MPHMRFEDIIIEGIDEDGSLLVLCGFVNITDDWPSTHYYNFSWWKYAGQEAMESYHVGKYAGRARYVRVEDMT